MADSSPQDYPTIIGPDANFKGELTFDKGMRIHGRFEGKITTAGRVHVAKEAKLQADVDAGSVLVEGEVHGNLAASDRIELKNMPDMKAIFAPASWSWKRELCLPGMSQWVPTR